jgi:hypothetical protein
MTNADIALATSFVRQPFVSLEANLLSKAKWSLYVPSVLHSTIQRSAHTDYLCVFVDLRTNGDYFPIQHYLTGFYNRDRVCLLRGPDLMVIILYM